MAKRKLRREEWHKANGKWTRSFGHRGTRVRLFQKRECGTFYRSVWQPGQGYDRVCLHTTDRAEAERLTGELLAKLFRKESPEVTEPIKLEELLSRYLTESAAFLDNSKTTKGNAKTRADILLTYFGKGYDVRDITMGDVAAYTRWRTGGGISYGRHPVTGKHLITKPVGPTSVESDLKVLYAALKWATTVRTKKGQRLLNFHPLQDISRPREKNPKRPVATWERYHKARAAAKKLTVAFQQSAMAARTEQSRRVAESHRDKWIRLELALVLLEATGRRIGSIRQLCWEDIRFAIGEIHWRAENDKKRQYWVTPIPESLVDELQRFQQRLGTSGGWLFPAPKNPSEPIRRDVLRGQMETLEAWAELPKLAGGLFHPYRRKWATERKPLPLKDVAAAGGGKDTETLLTCDQHADRETMLAVMSEPRKVTEARSTAS